MYLRLYQCHAFPLSLAGFEVHFPESVLRFWLKTVGRQFFSAMQRFDLDNYVMPFPCTEEGEYSFFESDVNRNV